MDAGTWHLIEAHYLQYPDSRGRPVAPSEFDRIMKPFGLTFDPDYREFVLRYGAGAVGSSRIYGLRKVENLGNLTDPGLPRRRSGWRGPG